MTFQDYNEGQYPYKGMFSWLAYADPAQYPVQVVSWLENTNALEFSRSGLLLQHAPARRVTMRVAYGAGESDHGSCV